MPSRASVDPTFSDRVQDMQRAADGLARALQNVEEGNWAISLVPALRGVSLTDPDAVSDAFSRKKLEEQFDTVTGGADSSGTVGDLAAIQLQGDLLASLERAFRSRYMSGYARSMAHAAARAEAAGDEDGGVLRRTTIDHIEDVLKRGGQ